MKRQQVTFVREDGYEVSEYIWGLAPKIQGFYAETYWVLHERRFLLIGKRRGEKEGPFREVLTMAPNECLAITAAGWVDPRDPVRLTA